MHDQHISTALELIRHHYEDGGKAPMLLEDPAGWFARKGQQIADLPSNAAEAWENYRNNPVVTAFREQPATMIPGAAKIFGGWAAEHPFAAARKVAGTYADFTGNPTVAVPNAFLSSSPLNEGEDEIARQIEYGIRPESDYPGKERYTMPDNFARGGEVREHHASGNRVLGAIISGAERGGGNELTNFAKQILKQSPESNLYQEILQNRGVDAARRVQRAADEIPNLGSMYTPNALREAFTGMNGDESLLMAMKPSDFGKFAAPIEDDLKNWKAGSPEAWDRYVNELTKVPQSGGFSEVPYLIYGEPDRVPAIVGHEGRHRSLALEQMDVPNSLVRLQPNSIVKDAIQSPILENNPGWRPYKDEKFKMQFQQRLPEDLKVVPETKSLDDFQKLQLPEPFAGGGHVDSTESYIKHILNRLGITPQDALDVLKRHYGGRPE